MGRLRSKCDVDKKADEDGNGVLLEILGTARPVAVCTTACYLSSRIKGSEDKFHAPTEDLRGQLQHKLVPSYFLRSTRD